MVTGGTPQNRSWTGKGLTRRRFVQGSSAMAALAAGSAFIACGDDDDDDPGNGAGTQPAASLTAATGDPVYGGTLVVPITVEPPDMDPTKTLSSGLHVLVSPVYSKLIRTVLPGEASGPADFTVTPDLAASWEEVDLQTYTFTLQEGVQWHDVEPLNGRVLVASDVVNALDVYRSGGPHASAFDLIDSVAAPDDKTVTISLKAPFALFLDALSNTTRQIFAPEAVERSGGLAATPVIGTGPFVFDSFDRGTAFRARRNPNYFREGYPYLDGYDLLLIPDGATRVATFRAGDAHAVSVTWDESQSIIDSNPGTAYEEIEQQSTIFNLGMNHHKEPFSDPRVRRAISMATDRAGTVDSLFSGHAITGWCIPWGFAQEMPWTEEQLGPWYQYNVEEAKSLLSAAGFEDGFDTTLFYYAYNPGMESQIQLFQAEMKANLNINIELQPQDYATYFNHVVAQDWDGTAWAFQIGSSASIDDFLYKNMHSESGANYYFLNDPEIDTRVEAIRAEPDAEVRSQLIKEVFAIDMDMMYRVHQPYANAHMVAHPQFQGWAPNRVFRGSIGYGSDSFEQSWLTG